MSFAPQNQAPDVSDAIDGSITSWYENINNCLKTSECVPGHYEYAQAPSYGNQCPIQEGGSTKIDVGCNRFEIVDLNNSYIDAKIELPITIPPQIPEDGIDPSAGEDGEEEIGLYYVGFKSSFDMIDQYRIYSNGDLIYTQNHANYESFLNYLSLTDSAKDNSPCFATSEKLKKLNPNVPGVYLRVMKTKNKECNLTVTIKTKIPLNAFPMLQNLKYFPGFMGKLQIEIYPSYKNLVWASIDKSYALDDFIFFNRDVGTVSSEEAQTINFPNIDVAQHEVRSGCCFNQINCVGKNLIYTTAEGKILMAQKFACSYSTLTQFHLYQAVYMIKMDVYNALEMNYLQIPLLFPIQTVSNTKFTYPIGTQQHFTLQNTATLSHCDTIFVVFPANSNERTVSYNPEISAHLSINSKYYPREQLPTSKNDPRFTNLIYDALNINNNPLMTPGKDIVASINPYISSNIISVSGNGMADNKIFVSDDRSNFVFAVPLSTDEDFMGGISSNGSTVQIELIGDRNSDSDALNECELTEAPVAIFLEDKLLKIYSMKPPGKPQIQITNATLDQIVASGGNA